MVWTLENPPHYNKSHSLAKGMNFLLGKHFPGVQQNAEQFFSLYYYLLNNLSTPVSKLQKQVLKKGQPIFSKKELDEIMRILNKQKNTHIAKYTMRGGADAPNPLDSDPSRSKFWDKLARKIASPVTSRIPPSWDGIFWYFHILYHMEQAEFIGPLISTALDTVTLSIPVIADMMTETAATTVSLAPVPYANFLGDGIAYMISLMFISFAVVLNFSRKHFGSAFKVSLEAVPIIGDTLAEASQSVEIGADRYIANREKMLKGIEKVSPAAEDILDYYTPDVEIHNEPPPPVSLNLIKRNVIDYVAEEAGISDAANAVTAATNKATAAVGNAATAATNKATAAVGNAAKATGSSVGGKIPFSRKTMSRAKGGNRTLRKRRNALLSSRKYR
jgi:hypothetical protein